MNKIMHKPLLVRNRLCDKINQILFKIIDKCITQKHKNELLEYLYESKKNITKAEFADKVMDTKEDIERGLAHIQNTKAMLEKENFILSKDKEIFYTGLVDIATSYIEKDIDGIRNTLIDLGFLLSIENTINKES